MKLKNRPVNAMALWILMALPALAQSDRLGSIDFPASGSPQAHAEFLQGVLLLHSFEYDDAREAFHKARTTDPSFVMAYWGEAMTHNHPIWNQRDREAAVAVLKELAPDAAGRAAKASTDREKAYLRTIEVLYEEGEKPERDRAYAEAMRSLHEQFPEDLEAAAFYALSLLGTTQGERDFSMYMKAAAVAEEVFAKNPKHPGAAHYLIHSYDDPIHAPLGLRAARVYAKIAPAAPHALHMPSHIFVAMGMWDEAAGSNEDSWAASENRVRTKNLGPEEYSYHAIWWAEYAYLQQGRYQDARETLSLVQEQSSKGDSRRIQTHQALMQAAYLVDSQDWDGISLDQDPTSLAPSTAAAYLFARGFQALKKKDPAGAEQALQKIASLKAAERDSSARSVEIMKKELEALVLLEKGEKSRALETMKEAAALEDALNFDFGPPVPVKPTHELLGEVLLELGQPGPAQEHFRLALERAPLRAAALLGLARSSARAGDRATARLAYQDLQRVWHKADQKMALETESEASNPRF